MSTPSIPEYIHESVRALPVLPTAVTRLLALTRELDVDFGDVARVIETDQTLMARVLRAANSPLYSVSRRVNSIRQATVLLGTDTIVNLALGISVMSLQSRLHAHLPFDPDAFGRHSIAVALAARRLAERFKLPNPGEAFVAGLLHDIGKLVLLMHDGPGYGRLLVEAQQGAGPLTALELEAYDLDHALIGHALCLHWNLPPALATAVAEHHSGAAPRSLGDLVGRANDLVKVVELGTSGNRYVALTAAGALPRDPLGPDWLRTFGQELPDETRETEEALGQGSAPPAEAPEAPVCRPVVYLQIEEPAERELLQVMLWSMGHEPSDVHAAHTAEGSRSPVALVTDALPSDPQRQLHLNRGIAVFDYAAWRQEHAVAGALDSHRLRGRLAEALSVPVATP